MPARRTRCARSQGASSCKQNRRQAGRTATAAGTNEKEGVVNLERNASAAAHHPASTQHDWQSVARMEAHGAHTAASRRQLTCTLQHNPAWLCPFVLVALQISNYDSTLPRAPCPEEEMQTQAEFLSLGKAWLKKKQTWRRADLHRGTGVDLELCPASCVLPYPTPLVTCAPSLWPLISPVKAVMLYNCLFEFQLQQAC